MDIQKKEAFENYCCTEFGMSNRDFWLNSDGQYDDTNTARLWILWEAKANKIQSINLNCNQLHQALSFGAPAIAKTKEEIVQLPSYKDDVDFQLETEMSIEYLKHGHSGEGFYCWYSDLPEEGSILLTEEIEAREPSHD